MEKRQIKVPTVADLAAQNKEPEYLFWVGSAGSYDDRAKKITRDFVKILEYTKTNYAVLGTEESDSGEPAKRAGNEFVFQMQAFTNIEVLKAYNIKKIVTCDPHEYSILKNEYKELGGKFEVYHHTQFIKKLIEENKFIINPINKELLNKKITFHDPCYLGRGNGEYNAPREVLEHFGISITEMKRSKNKALCCGAGGGQMFKEAEKGEMEIYEMRTNDVLEINADVVATACPLCMVMLTDGIKYKDKKDEVKVLDIAEIIVNILEL